MAGHKQKLRRRRRPRPPVPGAAPGTLVADPLAPKPVLHAMVYGPDGVSEQTIVRIEDVRALLGASPVVWLDVAGLGDTAVLEQLGAIFGLHRLALEDVNNVRQRPKLERYGDHLFLVARMPDVADGGLGTEQLSVFFGSNFVLTFQERAGDCFDPVRRRLREGKGRIRGAGPDYLVYALLDAVIDAYYPVGESCSDRLDALEDEILMRSEPDTVSRIHVIRRDLLSVRRALWPLREVVAALGRDGDAQVSAETRIHLRDCYDHIVELIDLVETFREIGSGLMDVHLSVVSNRMNEIMKVLTITATMFIPLTFISSVYGMNFDPAVSRFNMPELRWAFGYPFALALMLSLSIAFLLYFRRRGWLGAGTLLPPTLPSRSAPPVPPVSTAAYAPMSHEATP